MEKEKIQEKAKAKNSSVEVAESGTEGKNSDSVEQTPEFMPTPFGTNLVAVKKSTGKEVVGTFKRPASPPPVIKKKRKVLSEDKFAEALEKIIQRECFPELEKLKAQNAYLDAVANNDIQMMRELHTKYGGRTPSLRGSNETPSTFETPSCSGMSSLRKGIEGESLPCTPIIHIRDQIPVASISDDTQSVTSEASSKKGREPHELGLNEFLNTYTSEDDQSFQDIIDEGLKKHKIKYSWLYQQEDVHNDKMRLALTLPSASEQQAIDYQRPTELGTWTYKNQNAVMYIPDGVPYTSDELANLSKKKIEVEFKNTRFSTSLFKTENKVEEAGTSQGTNKAMNLIGGITEGKIGVDGKEVNVNHTPSVNGFKIVRTPSPDPGAIGESPFLTWGEIEGTPFRLDAGDTPIVKQIGTPYRMIATSQREKLALELAEKASQRYRDKKLKTIEVAKSYLTSPSPRPTTSLARMNSMSPAAQRLTKTLFKRDTGTPRTPR